MTKRVPLQFTRDGVSGTASDYLDTIEINGLTLAAGEYIKLKLQGDPPARPNSGGDSVGSPDSQWRTFLIVADDPPGKRAAVITTLYRHDPGRPLPVPSAPIPRATSRTLLGATLGIGLAPRYRFSLTTLEDPTGALGGARFVAVYATTRWMDYLPGVFQEDERQADFLARFLGALFVDGERFETMLDGLGDYLVPSRLPSVAAARFLAGWFNIDLDPVLPKFLDVCDPAEREAKLLKRARIFLARVLPFALSGGTAAAVQTWIDAVAEARGMSQERRGLVKLVEGYKMRRLFTLPRAGDPRLARDTEPPDTNGLELSPLAQHWGWLPASAPLAADPLARRAFLDDGQLLDQVTLGIPDERDDPALLARLLGSRVWLFVPAHEKEEPTCEEWRKLLAAVLPAHLMLEVIEPEDTKKSIESYLGDNIVLGVSAKLSPAATAPQAT